MQPIALDNPFGADADTSVEETLEGAFALLVAGNEIIHFGDGAVVHDGGDHVGDEGDARVWSRDEGGEKCFGAGDAFGVGGGGA